MFLTIIWFTNRCFCRHMSGRRNEELLKRVQLVWHTRSTEKNHAWFKFLPTMHCSPLCPCARVKRGTQTASCAYANRRHAPAPCVFAASASAGFLLFLYRFVCKWLTSRAFTCTRETISVRWRVLDLLRICAYVCACTYAVQHTRLAARVRMCNNPPQQGQSSRLVPTVGSFPLGGHDWGLPDEMLPDWLWDLDPRILPHDVHTGM